MTDPMDALTGLQAALDAGVVTLNPCRLYDGIQVLLDHPNGTPRFTYALVSEQQVQAIVLFVLIEPYEGIPCFQVGYAVAERFRSNGVGSNVLQQSIDELRNGLSSTQMKDFYLEAIVSAGNDPSNAIARQYLSGSPSDCTDEFSNEPALHYLRRVVSDV